MREDVAVWATQLICQLVKRTDSQSLARSIAASLLAVSNQRLQRTTHAASAISLHCWPAVCSLTAEWRTRVLSRCVCACQIPVLGGAAAATGSEAAAPSPSPSPSGSALLIRRTLIHRLDSMSDSLCLATLQLFLAMVRTRDPAVVDCLLPPPAAADHATAASQPLSPPLASLGALLDGLAEPRSHPEFADSLVDLHTAASGAHATVDIAAPIALQPPLSLSDSRHSPSCIQLSAASLPSDDAAMFASVLLNRVDGWLDASQPAINFALSALLAALAADRRPHVQLLVMGRQSAAAAAEGERSVLSSVVRLWRNGRRREHRIANLSQRLAACKAHMSSSGQQQPLNAAAAVGAPSGAAAADSAEIALFLRAWLTLEAFVVEWCAIQYSEQTAHANTQQSPNQSAQAV